MSIQDDMLTVMGDHRGAAAADRLCEACVDLLGVDAAAVSLVFDGVSTGTAGASSAQARIYDELQFTLGEGPCLDTVASRTPVLMVDLADPEKQAGWSAYGPAMLAHDIRAVYAVPVLLAGQFVGALELFCTRPGPMAGPGLAGALVAAELAQMPLLDLLDADLDAATDDPDSFAWAELRTISRDEVSQATGMLVAQLDVGPVEASLRLRARAYATGRGATAVARDILDRRLRLDTD